MLTLELREKAAQTIEAMKNAEPTDKCETVIAPLDPTYKTSATCKTASTYKTTATYAPAATYNTEATYKTKATYKTVANA